MNQPIPRSFFRDGQKAVYKGEDGVIQLVCDKKGYEGELCFVGPNGHSTLLYEDQTFYTGSDLTLLDRTIDQVMEGDVVICPIGGQYEVIARCGKAVGILCVDKDIEWYSIDHLKEDDWIVQGEYPTKEHTMTAERAKELREESMNNPNKYVPDKTKENYGYVVQPNGYIEKCMTIVSFGYVAIGNWFPVTEEGKKQAEEWRDKYLPVFLFELQK